MNDFASSPLRNIGLGVLYVIIVSTLAVKGYEFAGWSFEDSLYMVVITVFSVGYGEVHPVVGDPFLRNLTMALIVLGCTGMIYLTGAIVQFFAMSQMRQVLGTTRMNLQIEALRHHIIICGYGRLGAQLSAELKAGQAEFIVIEQSQELCHQIRTMGMLCLHADATEEDALVKAGIVRAHTLATVVPNDAVNVFITLSARALNPSLQIIARAESPSTERKLLQAGATAVLMPAHISAEHAASLILFPQLAGTDGQSDRRRQTETDLRMMGLEMEQVIAAEGSAFAGMTVDEIERRSDGRFFIVALQHGGSKEVTRVSPDLRVSAGDGLTILGRGGRAEVLRGFALPQPETSRLAPT